MKKAVISVFFLTVFLLNFLPVKDTDFGWHYRCGEKFLTSGKLCLTNNFSYFLPNYRVANPSFIYDIGLAWIFDHFGFPGVSFAGAAVSTVIAWLLFCIFAAETWLAILATILVFLFSGTVFNLGLRSQLLTIYFFVLTLLILEKALNGNHKYLFFLPLLLIIWVNTHIGFFLGPLLLAVFFIHQLFQKRLAAKILLFYLVIVTLAFLASLVNPFTYHVYPEIFRHAQTPLSSMIAEWVAPPLWQQVMMVTSTAFLLVIFLRKRIFNIFQLALLIGFLLLALSASRNLPFYYLVFFYIFGKNVKLDFQRLKTINTLLLSALILMIILVIPGIISAVNFDTSWEEYCSGGLSVYPCAAVKNFPALSGNVYAMYEWGGFLIWQKPNIKVFVDGRMPAWTDENGESPYEVFLRIIQTQPGWNETLEKWHTDYLLIGNGTFLDLLLQKEAARFGWQEKYRDKVTVIYRSSR